MKKNILIIVAIACFFSCTHKKTENIRINANTIDNLKTAIISETNASAVYTLISEKALNEGQNSIAAMFAAAAFAKVIHIKNHVLILKELGETIVAIPEPQIHEHLEENIQSAIDGETYKYIEMYPIMLEQANKENLAHAVKTFIYTKTSEEIHAKLFTEVLYLFKINKKNEIAKIWYACPVCGSLFNTLNENEICSICGINSNSFKSFEK
jgi:rubrerythrin